MVLIGLTGGIAAGKSLAAAWFRRRKVPVIDADRLGREILDMDPELPAQIRRRFGDSFFDEDGALKRRELGRRVFADPSELRALNELMFPALARELEQRIQAHKDEPLCVLDAALIHAWGLDERCDQVWLVLAPAELRLRRMIENRGFPEAEARERMDRQLDPDSLRADVLLDNSGDVASLVAQIEAAAAPLFNQLGLKLEKDLLDD